MSPPPIELPPNAEVALERSRLEPSGDGRPCLPEPVSGQARSSAGARGVSECARRRADLPELPASDGPAGCQAARQARTRPSARGTARLTLTPTGGIPDRRAGQSGLAYL
ncbi:unnamed protein product [Prorocentrum cordatum]|uniref:Uncharacterized protein n=1 Tax=Prorocentrum cordatum TaxID=2364126 RepID=A0ABN9THF7_9DINO|nr:unnamed protein product [Polarella glacialis]